MLYLQIFLLPRLSKKLNAKVEKIKLSTKLARMCAQGVVNTTKLLLNCVNFVDVA